MVGAVARAEAPGDLLWAAQAERWRARPPFAPGQGIVLVGGSGAGKSSLARHLARRLGLPARDADQEVEARSGRTIPELFAARGEAAFRALEAEAVRACLGAPAVVALGAGAWEDPGTREASARAGCAALWLAEVPERAWARVGGDPARPLAGAAGAFLARWADRSRTWWGLPMVLPLGRPPEELAASMAAGLP
jgi:shikimate kinase